MQVQPYLMFDGRCDEALKFYRDALGAEVISLMRFKDSPDPNACMPGIPGDKVMHAAFRVGQTEIFASDGRCQNQATFRGFSLSVSVDTEAQAEKLFAALGQGGQVQMPLGETFFARRFGMVADKFGVSWMVISGK